MQNCSFMRHHCGLTSFKLSEQLTQTSEYFRQFIMWLKSKLHNHATYSVALSQKACTVKVFLRSLTHFVIRAIV